MCCPIWQCQFSVLLDLSIFTKLKSAQPHYTYHFCIEIRSNLVFLFCYIVCLCSVTSQCFKSWKVLYLIVDTIFTVIFCWTFNVLSNMAMSIYRTAWPSKFYKVEKCSTSLYIPFLHWNAISQLKVSFHLHFCSAFLQSVSASQGTLRFHRPRQASGMIKTPRDTKFRLVSKFFIIT